MSHIFKLMKENVTDVPLETSKDSVAISEELERIKKEEAFYIKLISAVNNVARTTQAHLESEMALWELIRMKGTELRDVQGHDFDHGAAICKTAQACLVVDTQRQQKAETALQNMEGKLSKWVRDEVKSAKQLGESYAKLHRSYSNSSHKVNQINREKKVQLSDLAIAEKKRDDLFAEWEREGRVGLQTLEHIHDKSKSTLMFALSDFVQAQLESFQVAAGTLSKVQALLSDLSHFATSQEALQRSSVKQLHNTLEDESRRQKEIDNLPRGLHPSLMAESAAVRLFQSKCSLNHTWEAKREGKSSKVIIGIDIRTSALTIAETSYHVDDVLALVKSHKLGSSKVKISFHSSEQKDESLIFFNSADREAFYELFCLLRRGLGNSFVLKGNPVSFEQVKVWTGSWNMGDAPPDFGHCDQGMENWMPKNKYDFYVLSFQESEYTPRTGFLTAEDDVFHFVRVHLGDDYMKLAGVSLQHIRLVCFVSREHYHKISAVETGTVATGLAGVIGNKGACAISFNFYDARFCFVGSHLAARIDKKRLEARNQNYRDILKGLAAGFSNYGLTDIHHEFDYLIWLGDLNYRIDGMTRDEIIATAGMNDIATLLKHDQLLNERAVGNCFLEFDEPPINFGPTYRFNRGDRTWSEEKMREPAYCDRVLYKALTPGSIQPLSYQPCHDLMTSDHSPISCVLQVSVHLPAMPHMRDPMCKVTVKDIILTETVARLGRSNSPVTLQLQAPWLVSTVQSHAVLDGEIPKWTSDIDLFPVSTNKSYLCHRWIRVVVREGKVDLGQGVIYLTDAVKYGTVVRWTCQLADKGKHVGKLSGWINMCYSPTYEDPWAFTSDALYLPSYFDLNSATRISHSASMRVSRLTMESMVVKQTEHVKMDGKNDSRPSQVTAFISSSSNPALNVSPSSYSNNSNGLKATAINSQPPPPSNPAFANNSSNLTSSPIPIDPTFYNNQNVTDSGSSPSSLTGSGDKIQVGSIGSNPGTLAGSPKPTGRSWASFKPRNPPLPNNYPNYPGQGSRSSVQIHSASPTRQGSDEDVGRFRLQSTPPNETVLTSHSALQTSPMQTTNSSSPTLGNSQEISSPGGNQNKPERKSLQQPMPAPIDFYSFKAALAPSNSADLSNQFTPNTNSGKLSPNVNGGSQSPSSPNNAINPRYSNGTQPVLDDALEQLLDSHPSTTTPATTNNPSRKSTEPYEDDLYRDIADMQALLDNKGKS